jgi:predicted ATP-binding protein involved in virulence
LENLDIDFPGEHPKHLVITGKNGSGKTRLLDSMDIYLADIVKGVARRKLSSSGLELSFFGEKESDFIKNFSDYFRKKSIMYRYFPVKNKSADPEKKDRLDDTRIDDISAFLVE